MGIRVELRGSPSQKLYSVWQERRADGIGVVLTGHFRSPIFDHPMFDFEELHEVPTSQNEPLPVEAVAIH